MSRTDKDQPWEIREAEGHHRLKCLSKNCLYCGEGPEAKSIARKKRRRDDKREIEEQ